MFFTIINKNLNWEILTKNLVTFNGGMAGSYLGQIKLKTGGCPKSTCSKRDMQRISKITI